VKEALIRFPMAVERPNESIGNPEEAGPGTFKARYDSRSQVGSNSLLPLVDRKSNTSLIEQLRKLPNGSQRVSMAPLCSGSKEPGSTRTPVHPDIVALDRNSKQNLSPLSHKNPKSRPLKGWLPLDASVDPLSSFKERWEISKFQELTGNRSDKLSKELRKLELSSRSLLDKEGSELSQNSQNLSRLENPSPFFGEENFVRTGGIGFSLSHNDRGHALRDRSPKSTDSVTGLRQLVEDLRDRTSQTRNSVQVEKSKLRQRIGRMKTKLFTMGFRSLIRFVASRFKGIKRVALKRLLTLKGYQV
jgi:hypothetical protein